MDRPPEPSHRPLLAVGFATVAAASVAGALLWRWWRRTEPDDSSARAARGLKAGAAVLAVSVLLDSSIEHYRGSFEKPAMFLPPVLAAATLVSIAAPSRVGPLIQSAAMLVGATGTAFHTYNILKRPGGFGWLNLFYAAPLGAPAALSLSGLFAFSAGRSGHASKLLAPLTAAALMGTVAEAGLLHFRGAFQNPFMLAPVTVPPLAAVAILATTISKDSVIVARPLLQATALLGIAGPIFHSYGVHRNMDGWSNWSQMLLQGPPIPAPPAFLGISVAALGLLPKERA